MKYRDYKTFRPGSFYHLYNRGINKQKIFLEDTDYINFLKRLKYVLGLTPCSTLHIKSLPAGSFSFLSYALMPNHYHFLIRQNTDTGLDKLIQKLTTSYSMYFNRKNKRVGQVFQDTFKAKAIDDDSYLKYVSAYIHNNPVDPFHYPYSSFQDILGLRDGTICDKNLLLGLFDNDSEQYKKFVLGFSESDKQFIGHLLFEDEDEKG